MVGTATKPAENGAKPGEKGAPAAMPRPFVVGSREIDEAKYDDTVTMTAGTVAFDSNAISPQGFLGGIWLIVDVVAATNTATVAFADDAPWNVLDRVYLQDVGSQPLIGPFTGYDVYIMNKYGGYHFVDDPKASSAYSITAGTVAAGGSTSFLLYLPIEIVHRDALGALPNTSGSAQFRLDVTCAASGTVYDTAPTVLPTVRLRTELEGWQDPNETDILNLPVAQNPPAAQTTQYWQKSIEDLSTAWDKKIVSYNGLLRNLTFILRRTADLPAAGRTNGDADWPDPFTFQYEKNLLADARIRAAWRHWIARHYGYTGVETAGAGSAAYTTGILTRDLGVYPLSWARNFGLKIGSELRQTYLAVSDATNLTIKGTAGAAGQLSILYNFCRYSGDPRELTQGR